MEEYHNPGRGMQEKYSVVPKGITTNIHKRTNEKTVKKTFSWGFLSRPWALSLCIVSGKSSESSGWNSDRLWKCRDAPSAPYQCRHQQQSHEEHQQLWAWLKMYTLFGESGTACAQTLGSGPSLFLDGPEPRVCARAVPLSSKSVYQRNSWEISSCVALWPLNSENLLCISTNFAWSWEICCSTFQEN